MRRAVIASALALLGPLAACGDTNSSDSAAERSSAAGRVLGGEVTDDMLPIDTVKSTSPPAPASGVAGGTDEPRSLEERRATLPRPEASGGPEPLPSAAASETPQDEPQPQ